jgi:hypothetical protein
VSYDSDPVERLAKRSIIGDKVVRDLTKTSFASVASSYLIFFCFSYASTVDMSSQLANADYFDEQSSYNLATSVMSLTLEAGRAGYTPAWWMKFSPTFVRLVLFATDLS